MREVPTVPYYKAADCRALWSAIEILVVFVAISKLLSGINAAAPIE
jgi:hypothetical protein